MRMEIQLKSYVYNSHNCCSDRWRQLIDILVARVSCDHHLSHCLQEGRMNNCGQYGTESLQHYLNWCVKQNPYNIDDEVVPGAPPFHHLCIEFRIPVTIHYLNISPHAHVMHLHMWHKVKLYTHIILSHSYCKHKGNVSDTKFISC